jgi:hypothetical protein
MVTVKQLLPGLGVTEEELPRLRVTREKLILRPRRPASKADESAGDAVSARARR